MTQRESLVRLLRGVAWVAVGLGVAVGVLGLGLVVVGLQDLDGWGPFFVMAGGAMVIAALLWSLPQVALVRGTGRNSGGGAVLLGLAGIAVLGVLAWSLSAFQGMSLMVLVVAGGFLAVEAVLGVLVLRDASVEEGADRIPRGVDSELHGQGLGDVGDGHLFAAGSGGGLQRDQAEAALEEALLEDPADDAVDLEDRTSAGRGAVPDDQVVVGQEVSEVGVRELREDHREGDPDESGQQEPPQLSLGFGQRQHELVTDQAQHEEDEGRVLEREVPATASRETVLDQLDT